MKGRFSLPLAVLVSLGVAAQVSAAQFIDVNGTPYETAFNYLSTRGVVRGYPDGTGKPNAHLNRVEALKVLMGLRERELVEQFQQNMMPLPLFHDVDQSSWYAPYIEAAFEVKMVTGYPDQTFRPSHYLKVEEAIAMAIRAYGLSGSSAGAELSPYIQNRDKEWFTPYINTAISKNLIMHQGRLELGQVITRGRFFDLVYRLEQLNADGSIAYRGSEPQAPIAARRRETPRIVVSQPAQLSINAPQPAPTNAQYASEQHFSISMPTLGIEDLSVIHPADPFTSNGVLAPLKHGVGHLFSYPGAGGKVMIYGHSSSYPWDVSQFTKVFRQVNELDSGDRIYVTYSGQLYTYEVNFKQAVPASDTTPFQDNGGGEELILYTCWPPDSIAQRYIVHAIPVSAVAVR